MDKISGISASTSKRLLLDAGQVYIDYGLGTQRLIGVTKGGNSFEMNDEYREMPFDGQPGPVEGFNRLIKIAPVLKINLLEISTANILEILPGSANNATGTHDVITRIAQIATSDHITNVTLILQKTGTNALFGFKVSNALNKAPFVYGAADNDEGVIALEFHAHFLSTNLVTEPWEIFNPLEAAGGYWTLTYLSGANGSIAGDASQTVLDGGDGSLVAAVPADGYDFDAWDVAPTGVAGRTDTSVSADITATASFVSQ